MLIQEDSQRYQQFLKGLTDHFKPQKELGITESIGVKIKNIRESRGLSIEELAAGTGFSVELLSQIDTHQVRAGEGDELGAGDGGSGTGIAMEQG